MYDWNLQIFIQYIGIFESPSCSFCGQMAETLIYQLKDYQTVNAFLNKVIMKLKSFSSKTPPGNSVDIILNVRALLGPSTLHVPIWNNIYLQHFKVQEQNLDLEVSKSTVNTFDNKWWDLRTVFLITGIHRIRYTVRRLHQIITMV